MIKSHSMRERTGVAGFSMLELAIAIVVLVFALGSLSGTVVSTSQLARANEDRALADDAARRMAADLNATNFSQIFATYNSDATDDPLGVGTAPGRNFEVRGLTPRRDDADGLVGQLIFPTDVIDGDLQLREDVEMPDLGMPRDLNGDGPDNDDHSTNYLVLPVSIRIEWLGVSGLNSLQYDLILVE